MGEKERFIEAVAESDHLINRPIIRNLEFAGLREARSVFGVRVNHAVIDIVDVAFAFLNEGQAEFETIREFDHRRDDVLGNWVFINRFVSDDGGRPIHHDDAIWLNEVKYSGFADKIVVSATAKEDLDSICLQFLHRRDRAFWHAFALMRIQRVIDIGKDDFYFLWIDAHNPSFLS